MNFILDLLFPETCVGCGSYTDSSPLPHICSPCFRAIPLRQALSCIGCGQTTRNGETCVICRNNCHIDNLYSATDYDNLLVQSLIHRTKYQFIPSATVSLFEILKNFLNKQAKNKTSIFGQSSLVTAVPLHFRRLNWRGFNQSELLAKMISDNFLITSNFNIISKPSNTTPQVNMGDHFERLTNLVGNFSIVDSVNVSGKDIVIVDDVVTTGATLNECAAVLKRAGAKSVTGLVIANSRKS